MKIKKVRIENFRNYEACEVELSPGVNIFYGNNAQGKTNFLEAVYLLSAGRSWRTDQDRELISFNRKDSFLEASIESDNAYIKDTLEVHLSRDAVKKILINKSAIKRLGELYGLVHAVVFSPEDLSIVKHGPSERRKFLDVELCQISKVYYYNLKKYYHVLKQRNCLLKNARGSDLSDTLPVWDGQLVSFGNEIITARRVFIEKLQEEISVTYTDISGGLERLEIIYKPNVTEELFSQRLLRSYERDIQTGTTGTGIHKDDFVFLINNSDARIFGSQGQQRSACLALKLALTELIKKEKAAKPVLLLDDVMSELDGCRQKYLMDYIGGIQTLLTAAGSSETVKKPLGADKVFLVKNGEFFLSAY